MHLRDISFGTTSALVTGMALVTGLDAAGTARATIVAGLLVFALADNLTDSLSLHVYRESARPSNTTGARATLANFLARACVSASFVLIVALAPARLAVPLALVWGTAALGALTTVLARERRAAIATEILKHLALAAVVIGTSKLIGRWLLQVLA
jgi:VIT1/CCC1 family predicted Fe2+/Mn2+ transporter